MKVLILANKDTGLYTFRKDLMIELSRNGYDVHFSVPYGKRVEDLRRMNFIYHETTVDRRGINPVKDFGLLKNYIQLLNETKPEKVLTYTIKPNIYGGIACRIKHIPMYANVTGLGTAFQNNGLLTRIVTTMYKVAFKEVKKVFFENIENRDIIVSKGIIDKAKTHCLNGAGVNLDEYKFTEYPKDVTIRFLFIGRVMKEKGVDELFKAAEQLKSEGADIAVDVVGPFEDHYEAKVNELDKAGIIKYYGYQSDVKPFIRQAHCFVLPSYHEGMANTLLECGAMGRPLITSNIHGCLEAVKDGETGYLCNVKDANDLYKKMKQFIKLPYNDKRKMGQLSHEHVAGVFDKKKVVEETIKEIMG